MEQFVNLRINDRDVLVNVNLIASIENLSPASGCKVCFLQPVLGVTEAVVIEPDFFSLQKALRVSC